MLLFLKQDLNQLSRLSCIFGFLLHVSTRLIDVQYENIGSFKRHRSTTSSLPKHSMDQRRNSKSISAVLGVTGIHPRSAGSGSEATNQDDGFRAQELSREEAMWFMTLPEKVQRQLFTKEEQILLKAACELALLCIREEIHRSYNCSLTTPQLDPPTIEWESEDAKAAIEVIPSDNGSLSSSPRLSLHDFCFPPSAYSRELVHTLRTSPTRSQSTASRNFSLPRSYEPDHGRQRVTSWLADTDSRGGDQIAGQGKQPQFYRDPDFRTNLRQHLITTDAFDEMLDFGFPTGNGNEFARPMEVVSRSCSSSMPSQECGRGCDSTPSLSHMEASSPTSVDFSEASGARPGSAATRTFAPVRVISSVNSCGQTERDTTFRVTLTRPEIRLADQEVNVWRKNKIDDAAPDPWALEPLPVSEDSTGRHGAFGTVKKKRSRLRDVLKRTRKQAGC